MSKTLPVAAYPDPTKDAARNGLKLDRSLKFMQESVQLIETCRVPVIAGVKGACFGGAVDLVAACDMAFSIKRTKFSIKEIDLAIVPDLGTINRLPITGSNWGLIKELSFTGRSFSAAEAKEIGLIAKIFETEEEMNKHMVNLATVITQKSPATVIGVKKTLNFKRTQMVQEGLDYVRTLNMSLLNNADLKASVNHFLSKKRGLPQFPKL